MTTNSTSPYRVLFVCWGNICRSPAAECVFRSFVEKEGLSDHILCDSAGTIDQHHGNPPDRRMREAAGRRNIVVEGAARMVTSPDFERFDILLAMDNSNLSELRSFVPDQSLSPKIRPFCDYLTEHEDTQVPDPFYGGAHGFEIVLDLLEDGCANLLASIREQIGV